MAEQYKPKVSLNFRSTPVNPFALQHVLKQADVTYQYLIDNCWQKITPGKKPDGTRAIFSDIDIFRKSREAYFTWVNLSSFLKKEKPVFPEKIIQRLMLTAYSDNPLAIFIPWGFRAQGGFGGKELEAMGWIDDILSVIRQRRITFQTLLMPADIYATEINNLPVSAVEEYFLTVEQEAKKRSYQVLPWSKIRNNNLQQYEVLRRKYTNEEINQILPPYVIISALKAAEKRGQKKDRAFDYLRERLCEAEIIEETFRPVKLSMVAKNKDEGVDLKLPRLYLLPEWLQFPWL
ncbi:hypothetical protein HZA75_04955 [Candidatus Roizmanbacteria bacterium]|nr:hypothetical protein [Candidatus Roizmanbacteria bacterium]